jgi:S1-C subfamily serine protease
VTGSGGPLLDSKGKLIGINTAIFTQTGMFFHFLFVAPILLQSENKEC